MGELKDRSKEIGREGATAGVLLYALIAVGILGSIVLLVLWALM